MKNSVVFTRGVLSRDVDEVIVEGTAISCFRGFGEDTGLFRAPRCIPGIVRELRLSFT